MRAATMASLALLWTAANANADCADREELTPPRATDLVRQTFEAKDYDCAIRIIRRQAQALARVPDREGYDARFALRELALSLASEKSHPAAARRDILTAAAATTNRTAEASTDDIAGDLSLLVAGADQFLTQGDQASWLATIAAGVRVDRRQANGVRSLPDRIFSPQPFFANVARSGEVAYVADLAASTQGDTAYNRWRTEIAQALYNDLVVWRERDTPNVVRARCQATLRLVDLLADVHECRSCPREQWRWRPLMSVGTAYFRIGMPAEAKASIDEALQIIRSNADAQQRRALLSLALTELRAAKYDPDVIAAVGKDSVEPAPLAK